MRLWLVTSNILTSFFAQFIQLLRFWVLKSQPTFLNKLKSDWNSFIARTCLGSKSETKAINSDWNPCTDPSCQNSWSPTKTIKVKKCKLTFLDFSTVSKVSYDSIGYARIKMVASANTRKDKRSQKPKAKWGKKCQREASITHNSQV